MKQPAEAARFYQQALDRDPEFADAHYNLGLVLDSLGRKKEAIQHLRTARKLYYGK
jgi:tetratricopeptide (TPR) repeat protein